MRNTLPLLSRTPAPHNRAPSPSPAMATPPQPMIPTIRLTAATPSVTGTPSANTSLTTTILAPKAQAETRKRLVPKKSKLSLLSVGSKRGDKGKDLSDVARRVGVSSASTGRSFDIYVDPTDDPDIGEIVVVKKKKSRAGLDGLRWGALGDVTNTVKEVEAEKPKSKPKEKKRPATSLKVKTDEKEKWWTIGRGRKDSKEKAKEKATDVVQQQQDVGGSTPPEAVEKTDYRHRAHSFDSGILLNTPTALTTPSVNKPLPNEPESHPTVLRTNTSPTLFSSRPNTPTSTTLLAPPGQDKEKLQGSIALRAMRSMRSLANIKGWTRGSSDGPETPTDEVPKNERKKDKKAKAQSKLSIRSSGSSFEAGGLTPVKNSIRFGTFRKSSDPPATVRTTSSQETSSSSSAHGYEQRTNRLSGLSVASSLQTNSTASYGSSIDPIISGAGRESKRSSASSVRWDDQLETVKEVRPVSTAESVPTKDKKQPHESRRSGEGRKRPALSALFPETLTSALAQQEQLQQQIRPRPLSARPALTLEVASPDRGENDPINLLEISSVSSSETPVKKARPRPVSEQPFGKIRPKGIVSDEAEGVISLLDAATVDLANLINRLDLEATPDASPLRGTPGTCQTVRSRLNSGPNSSPVKRIMKCLSPESSVTSLRPYAQSRGLTETSRPGVLIGQQIAPWPTDLDTVEEAKPPARGISEVPAFRLQHRRTLSPPEPAFEPVVFQPLPAAKAKTRSVSQALPRVEASAVSEVGDPYVGPSIVSSSSMTFGKRPSKTTNGSISSAAPSPTVKRHSRQRSSLVPLGVDESGSSNVLMDSRARRALGMRGTMGSMGSIADLDPEDPDSDIPGELQVILCASNRGSMYSASDIGSDIDGHSLAPSLPPSPGIPPQLPLPPIELSAPTSLPDIPVFRAHLVDDEGDEADIEEALGSSSDDETKKSFDFTGELKKLNESGASDRRSFVLQLENAFKTPAKIDIKGLGAQLSLNESLMPPAVPPLPAWASSAVPKDQPTSQSIDNSLAVPQDSVEDSIFSSEYSSLDVSDSDNCEKLPLDNVTSKDHLRTVPSKASDGRLNREFKFGGKPLQTEVSELDESEEKPLTLSDIIPPTSHHSRNQSASSSSLAEDGSVLKSIYAKATEIPDLPPLPQDARPRLSSDSSSKRRARQEALSQLTAHARHDSVASNFSGMSSFSEVRRGFEFGPNRPAFYPPPGATQNSSQSQTMHGRNESVFSIASVSSYGAVVRPGSNDPFDYGLNNNRPVSADMSVSIDDTFSFLRHDPKRTRVDSDASSFYFNSSSFNQQRRHHHRQNASMASNVSGPPISLYNRSYSYAGHRRNDSSTSASSLAHVYGSLGANGGRVAWARHQRDMSADSSRSGFSANRLGRPGVGDKMFEVHDYGMPLSAISASPPQSEYSRGVADRTSFDSIMDDDRRSSMDDSLFDETDRRSSMSSEFVFGYDMQQPMARNPGLLPPNQFRPLSMFSVNSAHSSKREDDTMISMLGGGHVRRRSIGSVFEGSPCVRAEKRMHDGYLQHIHHRTPSDEDYNYSADASPNVARIIEKPSMASTQSYQFGGERMERAQRGLLQRQSLEESCLSGEGEDTSTSAISLGVFRRPGPASRNKRVSNASVSSGADTPPLSISDTSSQSSGSQSSIDLARLNVLLQNAANPAAGTGRARVRARARGHGHRRRISQARASRASVYETIEEELSGMSNAPSPVKAASPAVTRKGEDQSLSRAALSFDGPEPDVEIVHWDDEFGPTLRKFYALKDEAQEIVVESKRTWQDTPFSLFAIQSFDPPRNPNGMRAMLEHSQKTYGPLPSELRALRRRSRTLSRPSPYPRTRKVSQSSNESHTELPSICMAIYGNASQPTLPLQEVSVNANIQLTVNAKAQSPVPALPLKPFTPFHVEFKEKVQPALPKESTNLGLPVPRPRVPSNARRNALGWTKRSTGKSSNDNKENVAYGTLMSPNESLRIVRPRPRGRPTPTARTIRV